MTLKKIILPALLLLCHFTWAQNDSVAQMREVIITDTQLRDFSGSQVVQKLNDSVISRNQSLLTSLLNYNTSIYFKENGLGMVSSPSFRGTNAQQTAVIWNGININSQLNGQTDFNTLNTRNFNTISIRPGGGSIIYGSSAIGGTIHLINSLIFDKDFYNEVRVDYGSFNTLGISYNTHASTDRFSTSISVSRNSSDNDYDYPGTKLKNENGSYYNTSLNAAFAYKIDSLNSIRFYSFVFDGQRHFSRTLVAPSKSMYNNTDTRNLMEWLGLFSRFTSKLKLAYLTEDYKYFENYQSENFETGNVKTYIARYDLTYDVSENIKLNTILDYTQNDGEGTDINIKKRETGSGSLLMKHVLGNKLQYEVGIRKEVTKMYQSPVLFSFGTTFDASKFYTLKINASRNFRMPTFNDLYWQGSGNTNLKPETSYQAEVNNELRYKNATLTLTGYYIKLTNMLRWVPTGSLWEPENVDKVNSYGAESTFKWHAQVGAGQIDVTGTYTYTISRKEGQEEQLIYVPLHKATAAVAYSYRRASAYYRCLFNGSVFTTSDNSAGIPSFSVSTLGAQYHIECLKGLDIGVEVLNLFNEEYQNVAARPMPGRNYNMYLNFKF
jgi:vitamin B12 transporter